MSALVLIPFFVKEGRGNYAGDEGIGWQDRFGSWPPGDQTFGGHDVPYRRFQDLDAVTHDAHDGAGQGAACVAASQESPEGVARNPVPAGKAWRGVDVQRIGGTPWKAYAGGTGVPPMRNAQMAIPFMIATGTNEMRTTAKARRVDV